MGLEKTFIATFLASMSYYLGAALVVFLLVGAFAAIIAQVFQKVSSHDPKTKQMLS